jgi:hypothetical protein
VSTPGAAVAPAPAAPSRWAVVAERHAVPALPFGLELKWLPAAMVDPQAADARSDVARATLLARRGPMPRVSAGLSGTAAPGPIGGRARATRGRGRGRSCRAAL